MAALHVPVASRVGLFSVLLIVSCFQCHVAASRNIFWSVSKADTPTSVPPSFRTWADVTSNSQLPFLEKPRNTPVPPYGIPAPGNHDQPLAFEEKPRNTPVPPYGIPAPGNHGQPLAFEEKPRNTLVPPYGVAAPGIPSSVVEERSNFQVRDTAGGNLE